MITLSISQNVTAKVNLATCQVVSCCTTFLYLGILLRILCGPFAYSGVVAYHYGTRVTMVSFITMLTFKTVLKSLFILDFDRMAAIPEQKVMVFMVLVTFLSNLVHIGEEVVIRNIRGLDHFGRFCFNVYLGKVVLYIIILLACSLLFQLTGTDFGSAEE